jgi:ketosteroid isomerase-like protein
MVAATTSPTSSLRGRSSTVADDTIAGADALAVADRLFRAIEAGRIDVVGALYATDAVIWHNHDGVEQTPEENLRTLRWLVDNLTGVRYTDIRRSVTATGFVQQHVLCVTTRAGTHVELPACIVAAVEDGRITRLEEYLDSRHIDRLIAR